jgi:serine protease Do
VQAVEPGTPADKAGIEAGDIITKFNSQVIEAAPDLPRLVGATRPGTKSTLQVFRRGAYKDLSLTVAELDVAKPKAAEAAPAAKQVVSELGLVLSDLTAAQKRELKISGGVLVDATEGAAARAGLRQGDVILSLGNSQIADVKQFESALGRLDKGKPVNMLVRRGEWAQYVIIRPGK